MTHVEARLTYSKKATSSNVVAGVKFTGSCCATYMCDSFWVKELQPQILSILNGNASTSASLTTIVRVLFEMHDALLYGYPRMVESSAPTWSALVESIDFHCNNEWVVFPDAGNLTRYVYGDHECNVLPSGETVLERFLQQSLCLYHYAISLTVNVSRGRNAYSPDMMHFMARYNEFKQKMQSMTNSEHAAALAQQLRTTVRHIVIQISRLPEAFEHDDLESDDVECERLED